MQLRAVCLRKVWKRLSQVQQASHTLWPHTLHSLQVFDTRHTTRSQLDHLQALAVAEAKSTLLQLQLLAVRPHREVILIICKDRCLRLLQLLPRRQIWRLSCRET